MWPLPHQLSFEQCLHNVCISIFFFLICLLFRKLDFPVPELENALKEKAVSGHMSSSLQGLSLCSLVYEDICLVCLSKLYNLWACERKLESSSPIMSWTFSTWCLAFNLSPSLLKASIPLGFGHLFAGLNFMLLLLLT